MIISKEEAARYLTKAKELQVESPWMDLHVSPFEVIFNRFKYFPNPNQSRIFSIENVPYNPPTIGPFRAGENPEVVSEAGIRDKAEQMSILLYRQAFAHIGPRVLSDQMILSGIRKSLLLPVLHPESAGQDEIDMVSRIYGGDDRFLLGYCVPNTVAVDDIREDVRSAKRRYGIRAIKLNANITGIDLSTKFGKTRVEAILDAAQSVGLPIIVHGGRSPVIMNPVARDYASLRNLAEIDWGITKHAVIISHGGMMGASSYEIEQEIIPRLKSILTLTNHIMVDISALGIYSLSLILRTVEAERIVFGSDYHYYTQWGMIVKLFYALEKMFYHVEDRFLKIVATNPSRCMLGRM